MAQPSAHPESSIRHRYLADRVLLLLLYRPAEPDSIERLEDGSVAIKMAAVARLLKLNSTKLYDQLLFLKEAGYIMLVDPKWRWAWVRVVCTVPLAGRKS